MVQVSKQGAAPDQNEAAGLDRRRHRRLTLSLKGRFMREDRAEYDCQLRDISIGGAALSSPVRVSPGEHIVCYLDEVGRIEGPVYRTLQDSFVVSIKASERRRERLAATLTWLANREVVGDDLDLRRPGHERTAVGSKPSEVTRENGDKFNCAIIDISISGASVRADVQPPIGEDLWLGRLRSRVMRHHDNGFAVMFTDIQTPVALGRTLGVAPSVSP